MSFLAAEVRLLRSLGGALCTRAADECSGAVCLLVDDGAVDSPSRDGVSIIGSTLAEEARERPNRLLRGFCVAGWLPGSSTSD
eukprot:scaffold256887_cov31-Tisochrysis_lutea.AAC.2